MSSSSGGSVKRDDVLVQSSLEARRLFHDGEFSAALHRLRDASGRDGGGGDDDAGGGVASLEVSHNLALCSYCSGGKMFPNEFVDRVQTIRSKASASSSRPTNDGVEMAPLMYNVAVVFYQQRRFSASISLLEELYGNIDPLGADLVLRICLLLLDAYSALISLCRTDRTTFEKAVAVLSYLISEEASLSSSAVACGFVSSESRFKCTLLMCRAKLDLLVGNLAAAKKDLKLALDLMDEESAKANPLMVFLSAQLAYAHEDYLKSLRILNTWNEKFSNHRVAPVPFFNNIGCIHQQLKRYRAAAFYLSKALAHDEAVLRAGDGAGSTPSAAVGLPLLSDDHCSHVLYNMGIQQLMGGNPAAAFSCFQEAAPTYFKNPILWIRMAECCISLYQEPYSSKKLIDGVVGGGRTRRVLLPSSSSSSNERSPPKDSLRDSGSRDSTEHSPSLEYAAVCLGRALLLKPSEALAVQAQLKLAYVSLALGDSVGALVAAKAVISHEAKSGDAYIAHMYAAEALCDLNQADEALLHLSPRLIQEVASTDHSGRAGILVNLSTVHIHKGNFAEAESYMLKALEESPDFVPALLLKVYVELRKGNASVALETLKKRGSSVTLMVGNDGAGGMASHTS